MLLSFRENMLIVQMFTYYFIEEKVASGLTIYCISSIASFKKIDTNAIFDIAPNSILVYSC